MRRKSMRLLLRGFALYPSLAIILFVINFPIFWVFLNAFKTPTVADLFSRPPHFFPKYFTLSNFVKLWQLTSFDVYFINSAITAVITTVICMTVATLAAYSLSRLKLRGSMTFMGFSLTAYMIPPILLALPLFVIMHRVGLNDTRVGLIIAHSTFALPLSIWLLWGYFKSIPVDIEEAAFVDGATRLRAFYKIILPISIPGLMATSLFVFLRSWNDYTFALVLIQSESKKTLPLGTSYFFQAHNVNWDFVLPAAVVISIPIFILFIFTQKYLIKGIAAGALSGE